VTFLVSGAATDIIGSDIVIDGPHHQDFLSQPPPRPHRPVPQLAGAAVTGSRCGSHRELMFPQ
jgi:hypothetical protein